MQERPERCNQQTETAMHLIKALIAEFMGTFALIFIGAGAVTVLDPPNMAAIALAHGFVIMAFAYAFGNESNSYLNPALTVGVVLAGEGKFAVATRCSSRSLLAGSWVA